MAQWLDRWDELEARARTNPFAVIVMAQLLAQKTERKGIERLASKTQVAGLLYEYGYSHTEIWKLLRLIDWMMALPAALDALFIEAVDKIKQEKKMAYVTSFERKAREVGIQQGVLQGRQEGESDLLQRQLIRKFGPIPEPTQRRIETATSAQLETWSLNILDARTLDEVFAE